MILKLPGFKAHAQNAPLFSPLRACMIT